LGEIFSSFPTLLLAPHQPFFFVSSSVGLSPQVEAVLLFCSILVCLFGIMFASEFTGPGDPLYERLGELTLAVIGSSLAYYFLVVWTEVVAVMFPSLELSFVSGAVDQKRDQVLDGDGNEVDETDIKYNGEL
jgi:hypothetical protein